MVVPAVTRTQPMKILLVARRRELLDDAQLEELERSLQERTDYRLVITTDRSEIESMLDDIHVIAGVPPYDLLERMPNLEWLQVWAGGVDWLRRTPGARAGGYLLTNITDIHATQVVEHTMALLLALARHLPAAVRAQDAGDWWRPQRPDVFELRGSTAVVIGFGAIGRRVGELASAFGMRVIGVKRSSGTPPPGVERVIANAELHAWLPQADVVVLCVPLTRETEGMIGARELRSTKATARLVNVSRGKVVDEAALVEALSTGRLGGAALDVTENEPLPADSPLRHLPNVLITGHYGAETRHYDVKSMQAFMENLERFLAGEPLRDVVDKERGY